MGKKFVKIKKQILSLSNLEKILYPGLKIRKVQILDYYLKVSSLMIPFLKNFPLVRVRCPNGIERCFWEKEKPKGIPDWIKTKDIFSSHLKKSVSYIICNNLETLIWLVNLAVIEFHPWLAPIDNLDQPKFILFDLDPLEAVSFKDISKVALLIKKILDELNYKSFAKTTGLSGIHIYALNKKRYNFDQSREFVKDVAKILDKFYPELIALDKKQRKGVYIDWQQNSKGKTAVAPFSLRANSFATIAVPLRWERLKRGIDPKNYNLLNYSKWLFKTNYDFLQDFA